MDFLSSKVLEIGDRASVELLKFFGKTDVSKRGTPKEIKTMYDEITDQIIIAEIRKNFPDHSILTEETGFIDNNSDYLWIIDPLDGTGNFINNNPFFGVSISVWYKNEPQISLIESPFFGECYYAVQDDIAVKKIKATGETFKMKVSDIADLNQAYLVYCEGGSTDKEKILKMIEGFYSRVKGMRILGSAVMELLWVASGRAEAYITPEISIWDIAAGVHILKNSGGSIFNFEKEEWQWPDLLKTPKINLVASNSKVIIGKVDF